MKVVTLKVNGEEVTVGVAENETLQDALRDKLHLTGTKKGCSLGVCGACTVLVNGEPKNSCLMLAAGCDGAEITTIEGLATDGELHPLQKSFIYSGAIQCGYCTPGMVMSAYALITRTPDPTEEEIKEALGGNICRCTGYTKILKAVKEWKKYENFQGPELHPDDLEKFNIVGKSLPRPDAWEKVTGKAVYTGDITLPNMLHGKLVHCTVAHGKSNPAPIIPRHIALTLSTSVENMSSTICISRNP